MNRFQMRDTQVYQSQLKLQVSMVGRVLITLLSLSCTVVAVAQDRSEAIETLPVASRAAVATGNMWTHLPSISTANGRIDENLGILRAAYRLTPAMEPEATPEATVRTWLLLDGEDFGIYIPERLELVNEKETFGARHLTFQQTLAGVKVYGRFVHVNLDQSGLPVMATSGYAPHLEAVDAFDPVPAISALQAESLAQRAVSPDGAISGPAELLVLPDDPPRLIWRIIVFSDSVPGEWEVLLDANTGALIQLKDQRMFRSDSKVDGEGYVWLYDPLTASGQPYGGDYSDNDDKDNEALNRLRKKVTLQGVERGEDGLYRLNGPWVRIVGDNVPAEKDATMFNYLREDDRFEAVMSYYYIDESQRYIQSLNVGHPPPTVPITVNPHATEIDLSWYEPSTNSLHFGSGGIDDAEDAGIILHEYAHSVMVHHLGNYDNTGERGVLGEGFADYWAVSYRRYLMESGQVPKGDWMDVFPWDGATWGGRRADGDYHYDVIQEICSIRCSTHRFGRTWAALMMKLWKEVGREIADRLHLAGFSYIGPNFTLLDMAPALLQADTDLYNGKYSRNIVDIFQPKGFIPADPDSPPELVVNPTTVDVNEGSKATLEVSLSSEPTGDVMVSIPAFTDADLTRDVSSLMFTVLNYSTPQTVTVSAEEDSDYDNETETITLTASGGGYDDVSVTVPVVVMDNDLELPSVQFIHNIIGLTVDIYLDNVKYLDDFSFQSVTSFSKLAAGTINLEVIAADATDNSSPLLSDRLDFALDGTYQVILQGKEINKISTLVLHDDQGDPSEDIVGIQVIHGAPDLGEIDVQVLDHETNSQIIAVLGSDMSYGEIESYASFPKKHYNLAVYESTKDSVIEVYELDWSQVPNQKGSLILSGNGSSAVGGLTVMGVWHNGNISFPELVTSVQDQPTIVAPVSVGNFPNPFDETTYLWFNLQESAQIEVHVVDILGRTLLNHTTDTRETGEKHQYEIDTTGWPSGAYFYRIIVSTDSGQTISTGKMTKIK